MARPRLLHLLLALAATAAAAAAQPTAAAASTRGECQVEVAPLRARVAELERLLAESHAAWERAQTLLGAAPDRAAPRRAGGGTLSTTSAARHTLFFGSKVGVVCAWVRFQPYTLRPLNPRSLKP